MKSGQQQTLKMQQKLSPQQLLLMQLIQMPVMELEQRLKEEVEKNPVLEVNTDNSEMLEPLPDTGTPAYDMLGGETDDDDYSYRERQERDRNQDAREAVFVSEESFFDHLMDQLTMRNLNARQQAIAQELPAMSAAVSTCWPTTWPSPKASRSRPRRWRRCCT